VAVVTMETLEPRLVRCEATYHSGKHQETRLCVRPAADSCECGRTFCRHFWLGLACLVGLVALAVAAWWFVIYAVIDWHWL
jgi:hypothetical protein